MPTVIDEEAIQVRARVLGLMLREGREAANKSLHELGKAIGCSAERVRAYEFGEKAITLPEVELAAYYLGLPLSRFLEDRTPVAQRMHVEDPQGVIAVRQRIIGTLLQKARRAAHMSVAAAARLAGVTSHMLRKFELGDRPVPLPVLEVLAVELGVTMDYFREGVPDEMAAWDVSQTQYYQFQCLPPDIRDFVLAPANVTYLQVAQALSVMPADRLRRIAESLLDITY